MLVIMANLQKVNPQVREAAVRWLITFSEGEVDAAGRAAFNAWLRTSPEHVRAYLRVSAFWIEAGRINSARKHSVDQIVEQALADSNIVQLATGDSIRGPAESRPRLGRRLAIAASLLVTVLGLVALVQHQQAPAYSTGIGEQRSVTLPDGSTVELNAGSSITVRFSDERRLVELTAGQGLFDVAKNPQRPFIVRSGDTEVTAVGTQFDVYNKTSETVVTVIEGRVAIAERERSRMLRPSQTAPLPVLVSAGEQLVVNPATISVPQPANLEAAVAWTEGLLMFDSEPLGDVVEEFNRYNLKPLVIDDPTLRALRISGVFPATGTRRMLEFLQDRFGVSVHETDAEIRIGPADVKKTAAQG